MSESQPRSVGADRNLLFGILALQMDFISRDALIAALQAWVFDKAKPLGQILLDQGQLQAEQRQLLEALVEAHLRSHHDDPEKSLAALSSVSAVREELRRIEDGDLQASLAHAGSAHDRESPTTVDEYRPESAGLRYRIVRPHAKGGLGEVFVALDQELHREVALKEIQERHADDPHSRGRFLLEAEITGRLEHPGIVPVYGLGQYADGRPFYAMRFIKGDNLKEAIRRFHEADVPGRAPGERALAFRQLLRRFVDVCNVVAYAHSRGVLHRDLKPANIMLGQYGETLLVDWGLAKVVEREPVPAATAGTAEMTLRPSSGGDLVATQAGSAVGTPAFMSPEQASGRVDLLGPASDVYSLGATLYVLLTGRPPFRETELGEILHQVQRGEIPTPRQVKPDTAPALSAICLKAMALKPVDRYATALALAADIEHWLADEPVAAHPDRWPARFGRWTRRHRTLVAGTGALLATAVAFLMVLAAFIDHARRQSIAEQARTEEARQHAEAAKQRTRQALDEMSSQVIDGWLAQQKHLEPAHKAFLEKAVASYDEFAAESGQSEEVRLAVANAYLRVGKIRAKLRQHSEAEAAYRRALEYYEKLANDSPSVPEYRSGVANSHNQLGLLLIDLGKRAAAEVEYRAALKEDQRLTEEHPSAPEYRSGLAKHHNNLGLLLADEGKQAEAEIEYGAALKESQRLADEHPTVPGYRNDLTKHHYNLGNLLHNLGKRAEAKSELRAALKEGQRLADEHPDVPEYHHDLAKSHHNLGVLLAELGKQAEAESEYRAAVKGEQRLADEHPAVPEYRSDLAKHHNNLGNLLASQGKEAEAESEYRAGLKERQRLADEHPDVPEYRFLLMNIRNGLGNLLDRKGKRTEAEAEFQACVKEAQRLVREYPGSLEYRSSLAKSHHNLAIALSQLGKQAEAETAYRAALKMEQRLVDEHPAIPEYRRDLCAHHSMLANLLSDAGKQAEAEGEYQAAVALGKDLASRFPEVADYHHVLGGALASLAALRRKVADPGKARVFLEEALPHLDKALKIEAQNFYYRQFYRDSLLTLASVLVDLGDCKAAAQAADKLKSQAFDPVVDLYNAACIFSRLVPVVNQDNQLPEAKRPEQAKIYADRALESLRQAVKNGYKDGAHMKEDKDLDPIRSRDDFKKVLQEVERKTKAAIK